MKFFRKPFFRGFQLLIGILGENSQGIFFKFIPVIGQEMIVNDIHKGSRIQSGGRFKKLLGFLGGGMCIGIFIYFTMKRNAHLYPVRVVEFFFALHKITDHISRQNIGISERKECMSQIVHGIKLRNLRVWQVGSVEVWKCVN